MVLGVGDVGIAKRQLLTIWNSMSDTGREENGYTDSHPTFFVGIGKWKCFDRADFPIRNGSSYLGLGDLAKDTMCGLHGLPVTTEVVGRGCYVPRLIADRRVAILYADDNDGTIACRHCRNLAYGTQRETTGYRDLYRAQRIRMKLGGSGSLGDPFPPRPKGMHERTYLLNLVRAQELEGQFLARVNMEELLEMAGIHRKKPRL